jgi:phosphoribosylanthranilate isomerase
MFRVKICGVTRAVDAKAAVKAGVDAIGFQMSMGPRKITPARAKRLVRSLPPTVTPVGVFVNERSSRVKQLVKRCGFQAVQLHGEEGKAYCEGMPVPVIKAVRMKTPSAYRAFKAFRVAAYLLDSYNKKTPGGTGKRFRSLWARKAVKELPAPVLLSGGLTPENVQNAIRLSRAFGVDVASGVESRPGIKDPRKIFLFVSRANKAFRG